MTSLICGTNFLNCKSGAVNYEPIIDKIFKIEQLLKSKQKKSIDSTDSLDKSQDKTLFGVSPFSHWDYSSLTDAKAVWQKSNQQIDKVLSDLNNKLSLNQESFYNNLSCLYQGNNSCYFWSAQVVVHCFILNEEIDEKSCMEVFRKFHFDHPLKAKYLPFLKLLFTMKSFTQNNKSDNIKNFLQSSKEWV